MSELPRHNMEVHAHYPATLVPGHICSHTCNLLKEKGLQYDVESIMEIVSTCMRMRYKIFLTLLTVAL